MKSNSELMGDAIDRAPYDDAARCAFQDALEEEGMAHTIAVEVATVRMHLARQAFVHARAAKFVATRCLARDMFNHAIYAACDVDPMTPFTLVLVAGCEAPAATMDYRNRRGAYWYAWTVTVGAEWVMRWHDDYGMHLMNERNARRGARRVRRRKGARKAR